MTKLDIIHESAKLTGLTKVETELVFDSIIVALCFRACYGTIIFFNDSGLSLNRRGCQAIKYFRVRGINYLQMLLDRKVELST